MNAVADFGQRVVVTGGSGFIGTNLVQALLDDGIEVINFDTLSPRNPAHAKWWRQVSLEDAATLQKELVAFNPTHIYHMGARTDLLSDQLGEYGANTSGLVNLIDACKQLPQLRRVIYASSRLVCKIGYQPKSETDYCPTTAYGESKVEGEKIVRARVGDAHVWTIVRPTSIWGPWFDIPYRTFFDTVRAGRYFHPGGVQVRKSFGFVGNSVHQLRRIMNAPADEVNRRTFYIGDYDAIDVYAFAQTISREFGSGAIKTLPLSLLKLMALAGDTLQKLGYKNPPLTSFRLDNLCTNMLHDFGDLPAVTGPLPFSAEQGVKQTVGWMQRRA